MAYVSLGAPQLSPLQLRRRIAERARKLRPGAEIRLTAMERRAMVRALRAGQLPAFRQYIPRQELAGFKLKKIFKPIKQVLAPIYRPIVAAVKPMLKPLIAMVPGVGPAAAVAFGVVQKLRMDAKAAQQVTSQVQQASSWGTLTPAQQQAILNAITAGVTPSVQAPPDVVAAYQEAIRQQAAAHPEWTRPAAPPAPMPWEAGPPAEEAAAAPGMGAMLGIGATVLVGAMVLGGGGRRRE